MKNYTINGLEENIENFIDNADWLGIFNEFHCIMLQSRIGNNALLLSFGIEKKLLFDYTSEKEERLTKRLSDECKKFKVTIQ